MTTKSYFSKTEATRLADFETSYVVRKRTSPQGEEQYGVWCTKSQEWVEFMSKYGEVR